ncbi:uncharacterized protein UTRI_01888_B [Ustilago trichophora]|uniref:Uncharacterized protein n=1 Tax=Ustilago trichophora TaxID=86804 RepID=A0A5C3DW91_9BASI|nr:uncharacterized protein UTRI_01888_B [Ustilago trichophora]
MHLPLLSVTLFAAALALQVSASAPRCYIKYVKSDGGLQLGSGCPKDYEWTDCCLVAMSNFDPEHPSDKTYTGVCQRDPVMVPGDTDTCKRLGDRS